MLLSCNSTPLLVNTSLILYESVCSGEINCSVTLNPMLLTVISKYNTEHSRNVITAPNDT